jgi:hypothetical protein
MNIIFKKTLTQKQSLIYCVGILLLTILFHVFLINADFIGSDYVNYIQGADSFFSENPYSTHGDISVADNFRPPGYAIIIAFFKWFSNDYFLELIILFQSILLVCMFFILVLILKKLSLIKSRTTFFILFLFLHPVLLSTATHIQAHFIEAFLHSIFIFYFISFLKEKKIKDLILASIVLSLSFYLRPTFIYFTPIFFFIIFLASKIKYSFYSLVFVLLVVSPWIIRNKTMLNSLEFSGLGSIALSYYAAEAIRHSQNISSEEAHLAILKNSDSFDYEIKKNDFELNRRLKDESIKIIFKNMDYFLLSYVRGIIRVFLMPHNIFKTKAGTTLNVDEFIKILKSNPKQILNNFNLYFVILYIIPYIINFFLIYGIIYVFSKMKYFFYKYDHIFTFLTSFFLYGILISGPINRSQYMISYLVILIIFSVLRQEHQLKKFSNE